MSIEPSPHSGFRVRIETWNKIAEKVIPIMNDKELDTMILSAYENESQTLTSSSEANLLKFKENGRLVIKRRTKAVE